MSCSFDRHKINCTVHFMYNQISWVYANCICVVIISFFIEMGTFTLSKLRHLSIEAERGAEVLVCSKGGGGLLRERMEVVSELWDGNIKASNQRVTLFISMLFYSVLWSSNRFYYWAVSCTRYCEDWILYSLKVAFCCVFVSPGRFCSLFVTKPYWTIWVCAWTWDQMAGYTNRGRSYSCKLCEGIDSNFFFSPLKWRMFLLW